MRQHLTNWMKPNKIDELWNSANSLFKWIFRGVCRHLEILLLWQRDVTTSPLYSIGYSMVMLWCALTMTSLKTLSNTFIEILKEHPTTMFCKISVRRSKNSLEFSIAWGTLSISRWPFHSRTIHEALYDFLKFNFFAFQSPAWAIFDRKRKPKIFGFENAMERGIRKVLTFVKLKIASKIFEKIILRPL